VASNCDPLTPALLRLIPNPDPMKAFPVSNEGVDESDGVVVFKADVTHVPRDSWILLEIQSETVAGWLVANFENNTDIVDEGFALGKSLDLV
jgi:hypothetical protein